MEGYKSNGQIAKHITQIRDHHLASVQLFPLFSFRSRGRRQYTEIREQMYQDKLADLKEQLRQLHQGTHPDYVKRLRKLETAYAERKRVNQVREGER